MKFRTIIHCFVVVFCLQTVCGFAQTTPASNTKEDLPVFKLDGQTFTESQVIGEINKMAQQMAASVPPQMLSQVMKNKDVQFFDNAVKKLTDITLLKSLAKKKNITVEDKEVDEQINKIKAKMPDPTQFDAILKKQNLTLKDLKSDIAEQMVIKKALDAEVKDPTEPSEDDIKKVYADNKDKFVEGEKVAASHILIGVSEDATPAQKDEAKKKLVSIKADIDAKKITFADAAMKYSSCPSKAKGGDLGEFERGKMVPEFDKVAFEAPVGSLSDVVETKFGYHLIKVTKHDKERTVPYEEAKKEITDYLKQKSDKDNLTAFIDKLEKEAKVENVMTKEEWTKRHGVPDDALPGGMMMPGGAAPGKKPAGKVQMNPNELKDK